MNLEQIAAQHAWGSRDFVHAVYVHCGLGISKSDITHICAMTSTPKEFMAYVNEDNGEQRHIMYAHWGIVIPDIKYPDAPATSRQSRLVKKLTGRQDDMTRAQASEIIQQELSANRRQDIQNY